MTTSTNTSSVDQMLLDSTKLLEGYQNLLEMAKAQLESFDLSDEHIEKIAQKVQTEAIAEASGRVAANAFDKIIDSVTTDGGMLRTRIEREVEYRLNSLLQQGIYDKIRALIDDDDIKDFLKQRIRDASETRYTELDEILTERTRHRFRSLLNMAWSEQDQETMLAEHLKNKLEQ